MDEIEGRREAWDDLQRLAAGIAPTLIGLDEDAARAEVAQHPGLTVRFSNEGEPVSMDFVPGRIDAFTRGGIVIDA